MRGHQGEGGGYPPHQYQNQTQTYPSQHSYSSHQQQAYPQQQQPQHQQQPYPSQQPPPYSSPQAPPMAQPASSFYPCPSGGAAAAAGSGYPAAYGLPPQTQPAEASPASLLEQALSLTAKGPSGDKWADVYQKMAPAKLEQLLHYFRSMDRSGTDTISAVELANVALDNVKIGLATALKLIRIFDTNHDNRLHFQEYTALHTFLLGLQDLFVEADTQRQGRIDAHQTFLVLGKSGFQLDEPTSRSLYGKFDTTGFGLNRVELLALVSHIALLKLQFRKLDLRKEGSVSFTLFELYELSALF